MLYLQSRSFIYMFFFYTHRSFYTQKILHKNKTFTFTRFYTEALHTGFYTQVLLHTDAFTRRRFYTQALLHADAFIHKHFHRRIYTQKFLHTESLHTDPFTHRRFYTQTLLHADALTYTHTFIHRCFSFTHRSF